MNRPCVRTAHAAAVERQRPGGRARGVTAAADHAPLHERVRLADVVAARPCHRHLHAAHGTINMRASE